VKKEEEKKNARRTRPALKLDHKVTQPINVADSAPDGDKEDLV